MKTDFLVCGIISGEKTLHSKTLPIFNISIDLKFAFDRFTLNPEIYA